MTETGTRQRAADAFEREMEADNALSEAGRWREAYPRFAAAHDLGHGIRARHLAAHRAALRAAVAVRHPAKILYQAFFLGFAWLTAPHT